MMLKAAAHQVAGHEAGEGKLGPLVDDAGRFFKPLQDQQRGSKEVAFYQSFWSNLQIPKHVHRFFPLFYGTQVLGATDGSGSHQHLVIQDLLSGLSHPSVIDIKIGSRTWYPDASEEYFTKCIEKDRESTSLKLGFRVSGLQVYVSEDLGFWKPGRKWVKGILNVDQVRSVLKAFVSSNSLSGDSRFPDCAFASTVYGGSLGILSQLLELKRWFENQTCYHFYSASVLLIYDREGIDGGQASAATVKLIDFAHVLDVEDVIDHNFLGGLCSLIKFVEGIVKSAGGNDVWDGTIASETN